MVALCRRAATAGKAPKAWALPRFVAALLWSTRQCKKDDLCYINTPISLILIRTVVAFDPNMSGRGIAHCLRAYLKILEPTALHSMYPFFALHHGSNVFIESYLKLFTFDLTRYFLSLFIVLIRLSSQKVCGKAKKKKVQLDNICSQIVHYLAVHFTLCSTPGFFF